MAVNGAVIDPERQRQRDVLAGAFGHLGYDRDCILQSFRFSTQSNGHPGGVETLDLALFVDPRERSFSTIAGAVELGQQALVEAKDRGKARARELFQRTAAPNVVLGGTNSVDIWIGCQGDPELLLNVAMHPDALMRALDAHRSKLERAALQRLRGGQGVLFDRIYEARREELGEALNHGFSQALKSHRTWKQGEHRARLSRAAIAILAARILEDKGFLSSSKRGPARPHTDALRLLRAVEKKADGFFTAVLGDLKEVTETVGADVVDKALEPIMAHLTGAICFSLVTPEMLGHLYEGALIPERAGGVRSTISGAKETAGSKQNWIHYTPLSLTKHILRRLPLEEIRQDQRRVLDMACGSGSFLLAATERLTGLYDAHEGPFDPSEPNRVAHLRSRVTGYDVDEVALLVTRLTYLVAHWTAAGTLDDIPEPALVEQDAMSLTAHGMRGGQPTVIVGNPPFESGGTQLANQFLGKALDLLAPGGLLGMILPLGFLKMKRERCPEMRRRLLDACDLLEVWELPMHVVGLHAHQETCVVLARRHGGAVQRPAATLFKQTYSKADAAVRAIREHLRSARTFVASGPPGHPGESWAADRDARVIASPFDAVLHKTDTDRALSGLCEACTGIDMMAPAARFSSVPGKGLVPYMRHQGQLRPYYVEVADWRRETTDPNAKYNYTDPSTGRWIHQEFWPLYRGSKILVTTRGARNRRQQFVAAYDAAVDSRGIFPEDDFICLAVRQDTHLAPWGRQLLEKCGPRDVLLWMAAILNAPLAQAWVALRAASRGLGKEDVGSIPLPPFDPSIPAIAERILKLDPAERSTNETATWEHCTAELPGRGSVHFEALVGYLNHRIALSYGLTEDDVHLLRDYLREMTEQWVDAPMDAHLPRPGQRYRRISGTVVAVDVTQQTMTLDLPRYRPDSPLEVPLPRHIPGWALTPGIELTCSVPVDSLSADDLRDPWLLRDFMPVPYSYLGTEELEHLIGYSRPAEHAHDR